MPVLIPCRWLMLSVLCLFSLCMQQLNAQGISSSAIQKAIEEKNSAVAFQLNEQFISYYTNGRNADSLVESIYYTGKIATLQKTNESGTRKIKALLETIKNISSSSPRVMHAAFVEAGDYYNTSGQYKLAYDANKNAHDYGLKIQGISYSQLALSQNNMSTNIQRTGNRVQAQMHTQQALRYLAMDPKPDFEVMYNSYNGLGILMWYASKLDSAEFFYKKALETLQKAQPTAINKYYRPAIIYNNLSSIYSVQGKPSACIAVLKSCIASYKQFINSKESGTKKMSGMTFQLEATDNLGSIYNELGDYRQAHDLLFYSYQQKQKILSADNPGLFISEILLGRIYFSMREFDKSVAYLNKGLQRISSTVGSQPVWESDAYFTLAMISAEKADNKNATAYYEKADSLFYVSREGVYDNIYLEFLRSAALFYAKNKMNGLALEKTNKAYNYIRKTEGVASLLFFQQLLNLSEVYYESGDYANAIDFSSKAIQLVNNIAAKSATISDSIMVELKKPRAILIHSRSLYNSGTKDAASLHSVLNDLKDALAILERRKAVLHDAKDINLMMADHSELLDFVKIVMLELYGINHSETILYELLSLHESSLYNRLRSRLDQSGTQFSSLPSNLMEKENSLKTALATSLQKQGPGDIVMQSYLKAEEEWNQFLEQLRTSYPRYYNMRYASIFKPIHEVTASLPPGITILRYFFVGKNLMLFVADQHEQHFIPLRVSYLEENIKQLLRPSADINQTTAILHDLYQQLWEPASKYIKYKKVVVVPDGILYQLNFEVLTPVKIKRYEDLAIKSLLSSYTISYQYSIFLTGVAQSPFSFDKSYVAFAPGFSDEVKASYKRSRDSMDYDQAYLSLLPQPFTISLAQRSEDLLGGRTYLYGESTLTSFKGNAGQHKIIYIGTHAEADNEHPEFSRLIFAKQPSAENNFLYLPEIYNCNLQSNLTILTACETGVPGYQDGEGMISLAHAFNYAGSESIITGLWKIDEEASAIITELFYKNIVDGMPKDEALRQAKLHYLSSNEGRALSPEYWSGLVLIGNTDPVFHASSFQPGWIILLIGFVLAGLAYFLFRKKRKQASLP